MTISNELLDELLKGCKRPDDLLGDAGLMKELKIRLMERMLGAELTAHLGYEAGAEPPPDQTNRRNCVTSKRVKGSDGEMPLAVPRDRDGSFEPELVKKGHTVRRALRRLNVSENCMGHIRYTEDQTLPTSVTKNLHTDGLTVGPIAEECRVADAL